ncbi:hypothetical protein [Streptomyces caelestis]|uniref:hypothetical protein n=1 Tax=Streptomyces caelestis TaxID=36816 RepID=UPI00366A4AB4
MDRRRPRRPGAPTPRARKAHGVALEALGSGFSTAYPVCGAAAVVAAALTAFGVTGLRGPGSAGDEGTGALPSEADGTTPDPVPAR